MLGVVKVNGQCKQGFPIALSLFANRFLSLVEGLYVELFIGD